MSCNSADKQRSDNVFLLKSRDIPIKFRRLNVDDNSSIADKWKIEKLPTFIFLKNNKVIKKLASSDPHEIKSYIKTNITFK